MLPILFNENTTVFNTFGIGVLADAISCEVEENRNGAYELEMKYPVTGAIYDSIELRAIILAKPNYTDGPQPFRIYNISKPINGVITVSAQHLSYDLSGCVADPFTATGVTDALSKLDSAAASGGQSRFDFASDMTTVKTMEVKHPESVRALMGGTAGSVLDLYGGEWHFDTYECELLASRGENRGAVIRYGKNLTDLKQEVNNAAVYTAIYPYYYNQDTDTLVVLPEKTLNASGTYTYTRTLPLDLTMEFYEPPTVAELRAAAESYLSTHSVGVPKVNLTVKFVAPDNFQERIDLCDQVSVYFEKLGVSATAKCIRTKWDVLKERYSEAELGDARNSLAATIAKTTEITTAIQEKTSQFRAVADHVASKVTGNSGGYIVLHDTDNDGEPDELLIMDNARISNAVKLIRINKSGIAFSKNGYGGTYETAWNIDGEFVADFIASGTLQTQNVKILGDVQFYWDDANITIVDPSDSNKMIRLGKYDGTNYGLGFSIDGGTTWKSGYNFTGLTIYGMTSTTDKSQIYIGGDVLWAVNEDGVGILHVGSGSTNDENGSVVDGECYRIGTRMDKEGYDCPDGLYSVSLGKRTLPYGAYCIAIGYQSEAAHYSIAIGYESIAKGNKGVAIGYQAESRYKSAIAIGENSVAKLDGGVAIGTNNDAYAVNGIAIGNNNNSGYGGSIAIGVRNTNGATSYETVTIGNRNSNKGGYGANIGNENETERPYSIAIGSANKAIGKYAIAEGAENQVSEYYGIAIGHKNTVTGQYGIAIGESSESVGYGSAIGYGCKVSNLYAAAIGHNCEASGQFAFAAGGSAKATAEGAVALGWNNTAAYQRSFATGLGNTTKRVAQFVCGDYASPGASHMFVVGIGTASAAANALYLTSGGNLWIKGSLTQGSDKKLKNILNDKLPDLSGIRAVLFKWKQVEDDEEDKEHIGYIAQDVEEIAPYLVGTDEKGVKSLDYIGLLCAKVEQLEIMCEKLVARIKALEVAAT